MEWPSGGITYELNRLAHRAFVARLYDYSFGTFIVFPLNWSATNKRRIGVNREFDSTVSDQNCLIIIEIAHTVVDKTILLLILMALGRYW